MTNWIQGHHGFRVLCHESTQFGAASALHQERNVRTLREGGRELKEIDTAPTWEGDSECSTCV